MIGSASKGFKGYEFPESSTGEEAISQEVWNCYQPSSGQATVKVFH